MDRPGQPGERMLDVQHPEVEPVSRRPRLEPAATQEWLGWIDTLVSGLVGCGGIARSVKSPAMVAGV